MKSAIVFFVINLIFSIVLLCEANEFCLIYDDTTKSLEKYCPNYHGILPSNCSNTVNLARPLEVVHLRIGGCDSIIISDAAKIYRNVRTLDISNSEHAGTYLKSLELQLDKLEKLNASHNELTTIARTVRNPFEVIELDLSFNQLEKMDGDTFWHYKKLQYINLSDNRFLQIPAFTKNLHLKTIHIENNPIASFNCSSIAVVSSVSVFISWKNVKSFYGGCKQKPLHIVWDAVDEGVLLGADGRLELHCNEQSFVNLNHFDAGPNSFANISEIIPFFDPLIEHLNVSGNTIDTMNATTFDRFYSLRNLSLSNTNLTEFDFGWLKNQKSLNVLDISSNHLKQVKSASSVQNFNLHELNVAENQLENTPDIIQYLNPKLLKLDLSGNIVGKLNATTFEHLRLNHLNLSNTNVSFPERNPFESFQQLETLDISHNHLENENFTILSTTFERLLELYAADCQIKNASQVIQYLGSSLKKLDLSGNFIGSLNSHTLKNLTNLEYLNISNAKILTIDEDTFQNHTKIQCLDLSYNKLKQIDLGLWRTALQQLNLEGNELNRIRNLNFKSIILLGISNNRLQCQFFWTHKMDLARKNLKFIGDPWQQKHGKNCHSNSYLITLLAVVLIVATVVITIVCFVCWKYFCNGKRSVN